MNIILSTTLALIAFAGNSVLCRLALGAEKIDAANFTTIRLLSGIAVLLLIVSVRPKAVRPAGKGSWKAATFLFLYAITFSYAYVTLDTGTGALILFGAVQISMMVISFLSGDRFHPIEWLGLAVAFAGFVYLMLPGVSTPSLTGFILMSVAGAAWGAYTLSGKGSDSPLSDTCDNFLRTLPFVLILLAVTFDTQHLTLHGVLLAVLSGGVTSGIGYALWYLALSELSAIKAATLQLLVPVLAAAGGILFAEEALSVRLMVSSLLILGGIWVVILGKQRLPS
ncbi:DMT family transporter [Marinobacter hydrocarbonoclasticus]|nr:DMT family transporter [Marinobacter nauticus]